MFIAQLGRQPELSLAELSAVFGKKNVSLVAKDFASVETDFFNIDELGGTLKCGKIITTLPPAKNDSDAISQASKFITDHYRKKWHGLTGKFTIGLSAYNFRTSPRNIQKIGIILKSSVKSHGINLRLIPNLDISLSTATSHNNRLGSSERKIEVLIIRAINGKIIIAESRGVQNITSYTIRDRNRPKRDAFVGMLPPKLAQIMLNLATGSTNAKNTDNLNILDPFCGTGTILQEALIRGYFVTGSDLSDKMVDYTRENLDWVQNKFQTSHNIISVQQADATKFIWKQAGKIDAVVCETYLGQPFSAPPSPSKLKEVSGNCNHIISSFLKNIQPQLRPDTQLCIAVPAWMSKSGHLTHLPLINNLSNIGYELTIDVPLLYHRPDQVVAREILVIKTK